MNILVDSPSFFAKVCSASYINFKSFQKILDVFELDGYCLFLDHKNVSALIINDDKSAVICFRGSDDLEDWKYNSNLISKADNYFKGRIHKGFMLSLQLIWDELIYNLEQFYNHKSLYFCGHSAGGAIASLAFARLYNDYNVKRLYTFGSPRIGDKEFVDDFEERFKGETHHFTNGKDIIPFVPFRYYPFHNLQFLGENRLDISIENILSIDLTNLPYLRDHNIDSYVEALCAIY